MHVLWPNTRRQSSSNGSPMNAAALLEQIDSLLAQKDDARLKNVLLSKNAQQLGHLIDTLSSGKRKTFNTLPPELQADVVLILNEESRAYILPKLSDHAL